MSAADLIKLVREADPAPDAMASAWGRSREAELILLATLASEPARRRPHVVRRSARIALVAGLLVVIGGVAAGAAAILGQPAPPEVKHDIQSVDAGLPADLALNPDVQRAHVVASTGSSTLYAATLKDGGYCMELASGGAPRGAVCTIASQELPIDLTVPFSDPVTETSPVTAGGRVNASTAATLSVHFPDGSEAEIPLGDDGFFVYDVPAAELASVHQGGFLLMARDPAGAEVAEARLPADFAEGPRDQDQPLFVSTISDGSDFTKVLGVEGSVNAQGAVSLTFTYPDGTTIDVPLKLDRSFRFDIPQGRQGDLYHAPGTLVARDADGDVVAQAPVAAVAYWRGVE
nr:hypothetical protein [Actinomycetota bacterium]